jgi:hypothetical protein
MSESNSPRLFELYKEYFKLASPKASLEFLKPPLTTTLPKNTRSSVPSEDAGFFCPRFLAVCCWAV